MKYILECLAIVWICCSFTADNLSSEGFPQTEITNGMIRAKLYLPDAAQGYYQSTRFDWSGMIPELEYKGHQYFGKWFGGYNPKTHDAICGHVDEFGVIGYDQIGVGGEFLKIGVGILRKPDDKRYNAFTLYEIVNPGKRTVETFRDKVVFTHSLESGEYGYHYTKTVGLTEGKPELTLEYVLKNTGRQTLETTVYNHNFFTIDHQPTGPAITLKFPFELKGKWRINPDQVALLGNGQIAYAREFKKGESVFADDLSGAGYGANDYDFKIENLKSGAGVRIIGNQPLLKVVFWASPTTSCPEPYIRISVKPGEEFRWKNSYEFYTFEPVVP